MPWTCPTCKRVFSRNKQAHSCESYKLDPLFAKSKQGVRELYDSLITEIKKFGQIDIRVGSSYISIRNLSTFMNILVEKDHLTISFYSKHSVDEFPVYQNYQQSSKRWSNLIKIESKEEIDDQLLTWLQEAYTITS